MFKKNSRSNRLETKAVCVADSNAELKVANVTSVAGALLRSPPFVNFPLHIRGFTEITHDLAHRAIGRPKGAHLKATDKATQRLVDDVQHLPAAGELVNVDLDLGGMVNTFSKDSDLADEVSKLDVHDRHFRAGPAVLGKWDKLQEQSMSICCAACAADVDTTVGVQPVSHANLAGSLVLCHLSSRSRPRSRPVSLCNTYHMSCEGSATHWNDR